MTKEQLAIVSIAQILMRLRHPDTWLRAYAQTVIIPIVNELASLIPTGAEDRDAAIRELNRRYLVQDDRSLRVRIKAGVQCPHCFGIKVGGQPGVGGYFCMDCGERWGKVERKGT